MTTIGQAYNRLNHVISQLQLTRADHEMLQNDLTTLYMKAQDGEDNGRTDEQLHP